MSHHSPNPLERLHHLDPSSPELSDQVSNVLQGAEYQQWVQAIQDEEGGELIECLDKLLDALDPSSPGFRRSLRELRRVSGTRVILPKSCVLPAQVLQVGPQPVASGGSGDVYEGTLDGARVCVKRVRIYSKEGPQAATKALYKEAIVWKRLEHENIVPFLGITTTSLQLVSEWMGHGDLPDYIEKYPDINRFSLVCGIAEGLCYLHARNVIHGDLKGPNILVDTAGHARITDFGLATVTQSLDSVRSVSDDHGHTARWTAPEILNENGTYSKEGDVFSYAMVMIEMYTGAVPFSPNLPAAAMLAIMNGKRPKRPSHPSFTEDLWTLMQHCWSQEPHSRPEASEILKGLRSIKPSTIPSGASSTLSSAQDARPSEPPKAAARRPPPIHDAIAAASRNIPSQPPSDDSSPISPVNYIGFARITESQGTRTYESSQTALPNPLPDADPLRGGEARRNGFVPQELSRVDTTMTEPSPMPTDPHPFDYDQLLKNRVNHAHDRADGDGKSLVDPRNILSDASGSRRDLGDDDSRLYPNRDLVGNNAGKYSPEGQGNLGGPRSLVALGLRNNAAAVWNSSRPNFPRHQSQDHVPQNRHFDTSLQKMGKPRSSPDLMNLRYGTPTRRALEKDAPHPGVSVVGNLSELDSATEAESHNQSQTITGSAFPENRGLSITTTSHHILQRTGSGGSSQVTVHGPPRGDNGRGAQREDHPSEHIAHELSRRDTTTSEPSPMPVDPRPLDFSRPQKERVNQSETLGSTATAHARAKVTPSPGPSVRASAEKLSSPPVCTPAMSPDNESEDTGSGTQNSKPAVAPSDSGVEEKLSGHSQRSDHLSAPQDTGAPIVVPLQKMRKEPPYEPPPKRGFFRILRRFFCL